MLKPNVRCGLSRDELVEEFRKYYESQGYDAKTAQTLAQWSIV